MQLKLHLVADLAVEQGLPDGGEIADDPLVGIGIPGAQNGEALALLSAQIGGDHHRAEVDGVGFRVGEIRAARPHHLRFQLFFLTHDDFLHLFGGLVFVIFAEVPVASGDGDLLGVGGNLFLHQLLVFEAAALEAFP